MQIKQIEIEYGLTVNLGNYSNAKPILRMTAELDEDDDPQSSLDELIDLARQRVQAIADDELEVAGERVKYTDEPLYQVWYSELRKCIVVAPTDLEMPKEKTWRDSDRWQSENGRFPRRMRQETANAQAKAVLRSKDDDHVLVYASTSLDLAVFLPPLPDPGPEPLWHKKQLKSHLQHLNINEADWEELAALDHVNDNFLYQVNEWRNDWKNRHSANQTMILNIIRTGALPDQQPTPTPDGDSSYPRGNEGVDDEEDYEEEDEEEDE